MRPPDDLADHRQPCGSKANGPASRPASGHAGPLLLVEASPGGRACLGRVLAAGGFTITSVPGVREAEAAAAGTAFAYAVVNTRLGDGHGLSLVRRLRERHTAASLRIVVVTDVDSFASVILALRAGADDYIATPVGKDELIDALLDRRPTPPPFVRSCDFCSTPPPSPSPRRRRATPPAGSSAIDC